MKVSVYGDSLLKGVYLSGERYAVCSDRAAEFARAHGIELMNRSCFGATVEKGLRRLESDVRSGAPLGDCTVLGFGGNDCDFDWAEVAADPAGEHLCKVPPERFTALLGRAVSLIRSAKGDPFLTVPPPIDPERYLGWICRRGLDRSRVLAWLGDVNAIYRRQELYAGLVRRVGEACRVPLIDLRDAFLSRRRMDGLLCADGIHPTPAGHDLILSAFDGFLRSRRAS